MPAKHYRKKPVVIEAMKLELIDGTLGSYEFWKWFNVGRKGLDGFAHYSKDCQLDGMTIDTLEGVMVAKIGDYVIRGVAGEYYPCKPDIFAATYEEVPNEERS